MFVATEKLNSLPNNKILDLFKLKTFADEKIKGGQNGETSPRQGRKHCGKKRKCWLPGKNFNSLANRKF